MENQKEDSIPKECLVFLAVAFLAITLDGSPITPWVIATTVALSYLIPWLSYWYKTKFKKPSKT